MALKNLQCVQNLFEGRVLEISIFDKIEQIEVVEHKLSDFWTLCKTGSSESENSSRELIYQYSPSGIGAKEKIGLNYKFRISKSQGEVIDISKISPSDAGRYLCEVEDRNEGVKGSSVTVIRVHDIMLSVQIVDQNVTSNSIVVEWQMEHGKSYESMVRWRPKPTHELIRCFKNFETTSTGFKTLGKDQTLLITNLQEKKI